MGQTAVTNGDNQEMQPIEPKVIPDPLIHGGDKIEQAQSTQHLRSHGGDEREWIMQKDPEGND